ncbi:MAG: diguanylate cyclase [Pollutimonas bauzanensis]|uniref:diguanylate cyclase n=1 Tax=Pollutimonas bauzanensis TaxID=658167 RepID=A0A1M5QWE2_9BURK|nr:GGDEF domain-containing protein [Pollutimonas bauzanensis]SHH18029.1 diguanylate cyclase (GGDEF) domain-containing protein [Pollutimonas bauzanensis]
MMNPETSSNTGERWPVALNGQHERRRPIGDAPGAFAGIKAIGISSIRDTLSSRRHSKDFAYARGDYLRSRVLVVGMIFAILTPLWIAIDAAVLPKSTLAYTTPGRFFLMAGLVATIMLARRSRARVTRIRIAAGLLIALPAAFYALVLITLPPGEAVHLVGYSFIPFLLVATLSIFPFTLAESALAALTLLGLHILSQHVAGTWMTPQGWEQVWLLAALLVVALTANYFHLGLLLRLYREATHDSLTGLLNRGALAHNLQQLEGVLDQVPMSLLMLDMDHFKKINDSHGHSVGDQVLRQFASILRQQVRKSDFAARYGGEEFVAVLMGSTPQDAMEVAQRIRRQAETSHVYNHDGKKVPFTVSIGVAGFRAGETFDDVARRADDRLYQAKQQRRNCVVGE